MKGGINKEIIAIINSLINVMLKLFICRDKTEFVEIRNRLNPVKTNMSEL